VQPGADSWRQVGVGVGAPDQVVFNLRAPSAAFPLTLRIGIIAKHLFAGMSPPAIAASVYSGVRAIGTGPFKVSAISSLAITLVRNTYADPQPYLDHLILRTYPATDPQAAISAVIHGAADLVGGLEPQEVGLLQGRTDVVVQDVRTFTDAFVSLNNQGAGKPFFSDASVRIALAEAVDRQRVIKEAIQGRGDANPNPIPTADWAYSAAAAGRHPYDPLAAAKALDAAGWVLTSGATVRSKGTQMFKVELVAVGSYPSRQIADSVARQLLEVGVEADVKYVAGSALVQSYLLALLALDVGPDPDLYSVWHTTTDAGSLNFSYPKGWGVIDKDLEDGRAAIDQPTRLAAYLDFQTLMSDAAPAIFLYSPHYDYAVSQRVHGVVLNNVIEPADRFQYVTQWYVNSGA
jgi:peptide/nickel transport system substrate-binding protein